MAVKGRWRGLAIGIERMVQLQNHQFLLVDGPQTSLLPCKTRVYAVFDHDRLAYFVRYGMVRPGKTRHVVLHAMRVA